MVAFVPTSPPYSAASIHYATERYMLTVGWCSSPEVSDDDIEQHGWLSKVHLSIKQ